MVFGLRLSCREEALCYREPVHRTAPLSRLLPGHIVDTAWCLERAQEAMKQLTFGQKLTLLTTAAASGCEANVELAWQLLQPHVFPETLRTANYRCTVQRVQSDSLTLPDVGSAAVSSGLAHLLPSLAQRCPGLLDPGRTLEAAARHCDLAGLQAAWVAVRQQLRTVLEITEPCFPRLGGGPEDDELNWEEYVDGRQWVWRNMMATVASMPTGDALAKMEWILEKSASSYVTVKHPTVCGAAASAGDLSRLAWLRDRRFPWGTVKVLAAVVRHADLGFIQLLEQEGGYLPAEDAEAWASKKVVAAAAASARGSVDKLQWLAGRGAALGSWEALRAAAAWGNLEVVQLLAAQPGLEPAEGERAAVVPYSLFRPAAASGSVPLATWLRQAGYPWCGGCFESAFRQGDLPMVRWLLQAGCPRGQHDSLSRAVASWPWHKPCDSERLVEALGLLAAAGWPAGPDAPVDCFATAAMYQPFSPVLAALWELLPAAARHVSACAGIRAASSGCEATLEALVGMGLCERHGGTIGAGMYAKAATNGDRAALECLLRLGVPLGEGVLASSYTAGCTGAGPAVAGTARRQGVTRRSRGGRWLM